MTNKPMLSVDVELLVRIATPLGKVADAGLRRAAIRELRAILRGTEYPRVSIVKAHTHTCACVVGDSGVCDCGAVIDGVAVEVGAPAEPVGLPEPARWERMSRMDGGTWWPCANKKEADSAVNCGWTVRPLYTLPLPLPPRKTKADYQGYIEPFQAEAAALYNQALDDVAALWT